MNTRQTVSLKPLTIEDVTERIDGILADHARAGRDDKAYFDLTQLLHDLRIQLARERRKENSK